MKIIHVRNSVLAKIFRVNAITIYPFIFYSQKNPSLTLMKHEMIHVDQVREKGWLKFYFSYFKEFTILFFKYKSFNTAYLNISYEKEAYRKQYQSREDFS